MRALTDPLDPLELDRRTRQALAQLRAGPALSLAAARELVVLGFTPRTAWRLVEATLDLR
jgi:hypothetical protein